MFEMRLENVIGSICDIVFRGKRHPEYDYDESIWSGAGVLFSLDVDLCYYKDDKDVNERREVFFAIYGHCVWFSHRKFASKDELVWENTSNHDSCWRSDGIEAPLANLYFEMAGNINWELGYKKSIAPASMGQYVTTALAQPLFQHAKICWEKDPDDANGYKRRLISVEPVNK